MSLPKEKFSAPFSSTGLAAVVFGFWADFDFGFGFDFNFDFEW
jgi:hypothetical protein